MTASSTWTRFLWIQSEVAWKRNLALADVFSSCVDSLFILFDYLILACTFDFTCPSPFLISTFIVSCFFHSLYISYPPHPYFTLCLDSRGRNSLYSKTEARVAETLAIEILVLLACHSE